MAIRTIFSMAEDCARGERLGWVEFVRDFAGMARTLLAQYFPTLVPELDEHVVAVFRRAGTQTPQRANTGPPPHRSKTGFAGDPGCAGDPAVRGWFSGLTFTNEREFMMAFRDLVFAYGREQERVPAPAIALEQVRAITQDLSLLERELLWLYIKGYDAQRIAAIMMNAAATAEAVQRIADERLAALVPGPPPQRSKTGFVGDPGGVPEALTASPTPGRENRACWGPRFARVLMELAEQSKTEQCVSLKTFNNLVNGQISWRERELAEEHMSNCFCCIDRFTTFQEMVRLRKDVTALAAPQVEAILRELPFAAAKPRGVLSRLFAGR